MSDRLLRWLPSSAVVDGSLEAERPTWVLSARRQRGRSPVAVAICIASGPLETREVAESIARLMNDLDPARWDWFIDHQLRLMLSGSWG